ncbi:MAG TPA: hypothetical protein VK530_00755 [Candidatus Acidoferrum sp.]|nr:hypothetical protein [Candidatus Acidoferrum sp.]
MIGGSVVALAPILIWIAALTALSHLNQPRTTGTVYCWWGQLITAIACFAAVVIRSDMILSRVWISLSYVLLSMILITVALLSQIRMLLPIDL